MEHYPKTATAQRVLLLRGSSSSSHPPPRLIFLSSDTVDLYSREADINIYSNLMHACEDKTSIRKTQEQKPREDHDVT